MLSAEVGGKHGFSVSGLVFDEIHTQPKVKGSRDEYKRIRNDDYMLVDGMHEAIIDQETWEATRLRRNDTGI